MAKVKIVATENCHERVVKSCLCLFKTVVEPFQTMKPFDVLIRLDFLDRIQCLINMP